MEYLGNNFLALVLERKLDQKKTNFKNLMKNQKPKSALSKTTTKHLTYFDVLTGDRCS